jgi:hypothetical protein
VLDQEGVKNINDVSIKDIDCSNEYDIVSKAQKTKNRASIK